MSKTKTGLSQNKVDCGMRPRPQKSGLKSVLDYYTTTVTGKKPLYVVYVQKMELYKSIVHFDRNKKKYRCFAREFGILTMYGNRHVGWEILVLFRLGDTA